MFTWLKATLAVLVARLQLRRQAQWQRQHLEQEAAIQALAFPRRASQLVLLPPHLSLEQALLQAQLRRLHPALSESSPRSSRSRPQTERRTSKRRGRR